MGPHYSGFGWSSGGQLWSFGLPEEERFPYTDYNKKEKKKREFICNRESMLHQIYQKE